MTIQKPQFLPTSFQTAFVVGLSILIAILCSFGVASAAPGDLDSTFSGDGKLTDWSGWANSVAIQPDGKIVVVGSRSFDGLAIARYNSDGTPDSMFGEMGRVLISLLNYAAFDVAVQADGKLVVSGADWDSNSGAIARLNSDGMLDTAFDGDGIITENLNGAGPLLIQPDGKIVVCVSTYTSSFSLIRYNSGGSIDTTFSANSTGFLSDLELQSDGKIVATGYGPKDDFGVYRFNPNGSLDTTFDSDGRVATPIGDYDYAFSLTIQPDGKIVAAELSRNGSNSDFAVVRYNPNGSLDTTFDTDGKLTTSIGGDNDIARSVRVQHDGRIVVAGDSRTATHDFAAARYLQDGSLDTRFGGGDGKTTIDFDNSMDHAYRMALDYQGRAVLVGSSNGMFAVARVLLSKGPRRNGKIAFTSDRDGNREIYLMNPDGSNQTRLTYNTIVDDHASWSPDGMRIAYVSQKQNGSFAIFSMNADGSARTEVTPVTLEESLMTTLSWSPDGGRIAFHDLSSGNIDVFVVNTDGSGRQNLTSVHDHFDLFPVWSPDGSKILFSRYENKYPPTGYGGTMLHTINPDGTDLTRLLNGFQHGWNEDYPEWSPAINKIVYCVNVWDFNTDLHIANPDGTGRQPLFGGSGCSVSRFSPDGTRIVFGSYENSNLQMMNVDGSALTLLTDQGTNPSWQPLPLKSAPFDYDGDGKTDFSVWRRTGGDAVGAWYIAESSSGAVRTSEWDPDLLAPADYDGDGSTDLAAAQQTWPSMNELITWHVENSSNGSPTIQTWGFVSDKLAPADYDGDGKADIAVWRPTDGTWHILSSQTGAIHVQQWGLTGDKPVPADFGGDGKTDLAVWRPSEGRWYVRNLVNGTINVVEWGLPGDIPVVGDYSGDGKADYAVYRPSNNTWYRLHSSDYSIHTQTWGLSNDIPAPGDYDGDGRIDLTVFRPSEGKWYVLTATNTIITQQFGLSGDVPTPSAFFN